MNPHSPLNPGSLLKQIGCALLLVAAAANVQGVTTDLATKPMVASSTVLPNLMYVLDDSGSMAWAYMPDEAQDFSGKYGFASNQCNGVYYNPAIVYTSPVTSAGASYTGTTFTAAYKNGYNTGAGTVNLSTSFVDYNYDNTTNASGFSSQAAFYYKYTGTQTSPGSKNYYNTGSTFYTECNTTPAGSNNIATISISAASSAVIKDDLKAGSNIIVRNKTNNGSSTSSASNLANYLAAEINACTGSKTGSCDVSGYSAVVSGAGPYVVTITGPASVGTTLTWSMDNGSMTSTKTAFAAGPAGVFTKVTVSSTSGDTASGMPADERQNFANWYSYYRTRMHMMKTASGLAFSTVDGSTRVAYMTINNNVNPSILDFAPFSGTQKDNWYAKLYGATPNNYTPLRTALANVGRIYARKLTSLYGVSLADPIQYSCQQNFTILSTDGFWNDTAGYVKLDGTTAVGNQDGTGVARPQNDGAATTYTKTTTQLQKSQTQITKSTSQLVQTTTAYQTRTSTLQKQLSQRQTRTSTLQKQTSQLKSSTSTLQTRTGTLQQRTYSGSWSAWGAPTGAVTATVTISSASSAVIDKNFSVSGNIIVRDRTNNSNSTSSASNLANYLAAEINACTAYRTGECDVSGYSATVSGTGPYVVTITGPANAGNTLSWSMDNGSMTSTKTAFASNNDGTCVYSSTKQCQYSWSAWSEAAGTCNKSYDTSTSTGTVWNGPGTDCQYTAWTAAANTASCTAAAQSAGPTSYTVLEATQCTNPVISAWANTTAACTPAVDGGGLTTECRYGTPTVWSNVSSCTEVAQDYATETTARECQWLVTSPWANASSCTAGTDGSGVKTECQYTTWTAWSNVTANRYATVTISAASSAVIKDDFSAGGNKIVRNKTNNGNSTSSASNLANYLATEINACTSGRTGSCDVSGYSAVVSGTGPYVVTIYGPSSTSPSAGTTLSWSMDNGSMTSTKTAFVSNTGTCSAAPQDYATQTARECQTNSVSVGVASCTPSGSVTCATVTTGPTDVSSCTAASASSSNSYTATTCSTRVKTAPYGVSTCTAAAASTANGGVATVCNTVTTTTTVATCTPQAAADPDWKTITCSAPSSSGGNSNTLADVAQYYYLSDLRTTALSNCTSGSGGATLCAAPVAGVDSYNNVPPSGYDTANYQHMTTFTVGLGVRGSMTYDPDVPYMGATSGDFFDVKNGTTVPDPQNGICSWQAPGTICNWPTPVSGTQTTIDDLWHAAVNGRGTYYSATDPAELKSGLDDALGNMRGSHKAIAAATVSNPNLSTNDNYIFGSTFSTAGWDGDLVRQQLDINTGMAVVDSDGVPVEDWSAQDKLNAKTSRAIYIFDNGASNKLKSFTWANLTTTEQNYFKEPNISSGPPTGTTGLSQFTATSPATASITKLSTTNQGTSYAAGANLVEYLRGVRTWEGAANNNAKYYRQRTYVLGDIVNGSAVAVKAPQFGYADAGYGAFKATYYTRQPMVYAAANDGMLHAFYAYGGDGGDGQDPVQYMDADGKVAASGTLVKGGDEAWAYVPTMVLPKLFTLADKNYANKHQYFVDATPVVGDICSSDCTSASAVWKTILVGGLGGGGKGYYALDITNPATPKALWEFTTANAATLGYTYGNPVITKLNGSVANGANANKWVVLVASGYNNSDGVGRLYVLDANTGALIRTISTGTGNTTTPGPSGLSQITAIGSDTKGKSNAVSQVYGGDLLGNLWRFDVNGDVGAVVTTPDAFEAQLLVTLKNASNAVQSITTRPKAALVDGNLVIYVGTGRYLGESDLSTTSVQSMYAIKDPLTGTAAPNTTPVHSNVRAAGFVSQDLTIATCSTQYVCTSGKAVRTSTDKTVNFATDSGWYIDLPGSGERIFTEALLSHGTLAFTSNVPPASTSDCNLIDGSSYIYLVNYRTGGPVKPSYATSNTVSGRLLGNALASSPQIFLTPDSSPRITVTLSKNKAGKDGALGNIDTRSTSPSSSGTGTAIQDNCTEGNRCDMDLGRDVSPPPVARRTSWRELNIDQ